MKKTARLVILTTVALIQLVSQPRAEDELEIVYDLYLHDSCLTAWLDLAPLLTSKALDQLRDGIDLAVECRAALETPRRFFADRTVAEAVRRMRLSHREVTSDYVLVTGDTARSGPREFSSMAALFQFLRDSVDVCIAAVSDLKPEDSYHVTLTVTSIALTAFNLDGTTRNGTESDSPVKYLFKQFLKLTDYGRREGSARSRRFSLDEVEDGP